MRRMLAAVCALLGALALVGATMEGGCGADCRYFHYYAIIDEHITHRQRLESICASWRFALQVYRAVQRTPAAREALAARRYQSEVTYTAREDFITALAPHGLTARAIARQPTGVFTLQLYVFSDPRNLRRFLRRMPRPRDYDWEGTQIFDRTTKAFQFTYGSDLVCKLDPLYLVRHDGHTHVRYGVYASAADARRDAAAWQRRYGITPVVVPVRLRPGLVDALLWDGVPGLYEEWTD